MVDLLDAPVAAKTKTGWEAVYARGDELIMGLPCWEPADIVHQVVAEMGANWQLYQDAVYPGAYRKLVDHWGQQRRTVLAARVAMTVEGLKERAAELQRKWAWVAEEVPGRGVHVSLLKMTRADLLDAARHRREQAGWHLGRAILWERLARGMNETQTVEDRYTVGELETIKNEIKAGE